MVVDINVKSESEWVEDSGIVPDVEFLYKDEDVLRMSTKEYTFEEEFRGYEDGESVYIGLGRYDFTNQNEVNMDYPMRKGDEINFQVAYLIPEKMIDYTYLVFKSSLTSSSSEGDIHADDLYTHIYDVLVKVK